MANNILIQTGEYVSTEEVSAGLHIPRTKMAIGTQGSDNGDADSGSGASSNRTLRIISASDDPVAAAMADQGAGVDTFYTFAATNLVNSIKSTPGRLYALEMSNPNPVDVFVQLFDLAAAGVTLGTTVPKQSYLCPAGTGGLRGGFDKIFTIGMKFNTAITWAVTTTPTGNGNPPSACNFNALYK